MIDCSIKARKQCLNRIVYLLLLVFIFELSGCSSSPVNKSPQEQTTAANETDPLEGVNRNIYNFNQSFDDYIASPIAKGYRWVLPQFVRTGVSNFFANLDTINVALNTFLQGEIREGFQDTGRFFVNSTIGIGGLFDVATSVGIEQHDEDFDQTLAVWGVPKGAYLVMPLIGPTHVRRIPASVVDTLANPATYFSFLPLAGLAAVDARSNAEGALKFIDDVALDPYVFTRESYIQWRDNLETNGQGKVTDDFLDDFEDEFYDEDEFSSASEEIEAVDANKASSKNSVAKDKSASLAKKSTRKVKAQ